MQLSFEHDGGGRLGDMMKRYSLASACALALAATGVHAQILPAVAPDPMAPEARADWIAANIKLTPDWKVLGITPSAVVIVQSRMQPAGGKLNSVMLVERFAPMTNDGFAWKSARFDIESKCGDASATYDGSKVTYKAATTLISAKMTAYAGQGLSGASHAVPPPAPGSLDSTGAYALRSMCDLAAMKDVKGEVEAESLQRPAAEAWADKTLDATGWSNRTYSLDRFVYFADLPKAPSTGKVKFRMRIEYLLPSSANGSVMRSQTDTVEMDCKAGQYMTPQTTMFARHNMKDKITQTAISLPNPISGNSYMRAIRPLVCA